MPPGDVGVRGDWGGLDEEPDRRPSDTTATSSGTASCVRIWYAEVPGTSPCRGDSSTFSTRVVGIGDMGASPSLASAKSSLSSFEDSAGSQTSEAAHQACTAGGDSVPISRVPGSSSSTLFRGTTSFGLRGFSAMVAMGAREGRRWQLLEFLEVTPEVQPRGNTYADVPGSESDLRT